MLTVKYDGVKYTNFIKVSVQTDIDHCASSANLEITKRGSDNIPLKQGEKIEVFAGDEKIFNGFIDSIMISYNATTHNVFIQARSKTSDLVDSQITEHKQYKDLTIVELCNKVCEKFNILVVSKLLSATRYKSIPVPKIGEKAFNFLENFARKAQILLTDDGDGNLVITRAGNLRSTLIIKNTEENKETNNVKSAERKIDVSKQFYSYVVHSQADPTINDSFTVKDLIEQKREVNDETIRKARSCVFYTEETTIDDELELRGTWEKNSRKGRAFSYSATLPGFGINDEVWKKNTIYSIQDDFTEIQGEFLCKSVEYSFSLFEGTQTKLVFTVPEAYQV